MNRTGARALLALAAASPAFLALWIVFRFGVDVPTMDDWAPDVGGAFVKLRQGRLALSDLVAQHNEHRMVVPRLVILGLGMLTDWNMKWALFVAWLIACATSAGILAIGGGLRLEGAALLRWFLCNLLIFSPAQWETWLWDLGIANVLPAACFVLGVLVLGSNAPPWRQLSVALLLATAATFSTASGALAWPILGFLIAAPASSRPVALRRRMLAVWAAGFLVNVLLFAWNYVEPPHPPGVDAYFASVPRLVHHTLVFLGSPFAGSGRVHPVTLAGVVGGVLVLTLAATIAAFLTSASPRHDAEVRRRMWSWVAIGVFAIGSGAGVALFRAGFGAEQATESRYITYAVFLPIALVHLVPLGFAGASRVPAFLAGSLLVLEVLSVPSALRSCATSRTKRRQAKAELVVLDLLRDDARLVRTLCFDPSSLVPMAYALDELGCLRPPLIRDARAAGMSMGGTTSPQDARGKLEESRRAGPDQWIVRGWASNARGSAPADGVLLAYDDGRNAPVPFALADMGVKRTDLLDTEGGDEPVAAGWTAGFPAHRLPAGRERLRVRAFVIDADAGTLHAIDGEALFGGNPGK